MVLDAARTDEFWATRQAIPTACTSGCTCSRPLPLVHARASSSLFLSQSKLRAFSRPPHEHQSELSIKQAGSQPVKLITRRNRAVGPPRRAGPPRRVGPPRGQIRPLHPSIRTVECQNSANWPDVHFGTRGILTWPYPIIPYFRFILVCIIWIAPAIKLRDPRRTLSLR